ncbi:hypothetical protein [Sandaracinobacteroides saxicola]|uniref:Uncharacterized protein n=1 Tax=Sandaracinobacteroides saxicola TaxID=2759707 RepID=A0A7G5IKQ8_9SPHN|nr:hypothetical protein [Sandaracinobacteroides saxicola]QMW23950.1 hypothetical protein H3309_05635 [Sandaracinobacteroides saxicola]
MSNSDGFLPALLGVIAAGLLALVGNAVWVDPFRVFGEGRGHHLCPSGWLAGVERVQKPLILAFRRPEVALIGSSKVMQGFDERDAAVVFRGARVANLGMAAADMRVVLDMAGRALRTPSMRQLWIGLDFGMLAPQDAAPALATADGTSRWERLRRGVLSAEALKAAVSMRIGDCDVPRLSGWGFNVGRVDRRGDGVAVRRQVLATLAPLKEPGRRVQAEAAALGGLRALAGAAQRRGVRLVLFHSPVSADYRRLLEAEGLVAAERSWRRQVAGLPGVTLVEVRPQAFYDLTHYRPEVGRTILMTGQAIMSR